MTEEFSALRPQEAFVPGEPKAEVRVKLVNPESGYESEFNGHVTVSEWAAIDAILCGRGWAHVAALDLLAALERIATVDMGGGFLGAQACRQVAAEAIAKATTSPADKLGGGAGQ